MFQAFLAATPKHPIIAQALLNTEEYFLSKFNILNKATDQAKSTNHEVNAIKMSELMLGQTHGNIGGNLLAHAICTFQKIPYQDCLSTGALKGDMCVDSVFTSNTSTSGYPHVTQLFYEKSLSKIRLKYKHRGAIIGGGIFPEDRHACEYVVIERTTGTILFYSRTYDAHLNQYCLVAWAFLPLKHLPTLRGTQIPKIVHVFGPYKKLTSQYWREANPAFAVKRWTPKEARDFLPDIALELFPNFLYAPCNRSLPDSVVGAMFSTAVMYKYGGIWTTTETKHAREFLPATWMMPYQTLNRKSGDFHTWLQQASDRSLPSSRVKCFYDNDGLRGVGIEANHPALHLAMRTMLQTCQNLGTPVAEFSNVVFESLSKLTQHICTTPGAAVRRLVEPNALGQVFRNDVLQHRRRLWGSRKAHGKNSWQDQNIQVVAALWRQRQMQTKA